MLSVIRMSSPVSRVAASTRAAVFTTSPMTVKSRRLPPPIVPTTTRPELTPSPDPEVAAEALAYESGDVACGSERPSGVIAVALRCAEDGQEPVADELVRVAAVSFDHRDHHLVELIEACDDSLRSGMLGEFSEPAYVEEQNRDLDLLSSQVCALSEDSRGQGRIDEGAERLVQLLTFTEPGDHHVERCRQLACLISGDDRHSRVEVACRRADALRRGDQRLVLRRRRPARG